MLRRLFLLLLVILAPRAQSQNSETVLRGLRSFRVQAFEMESSIPFDTALVRSAVELELRKAGIRVLSADSTNLYVGKVSIRVDGLNFVQGDRPSITVYEVSLIVDRWLVIPDSTSAKTPPSYTLALVWGLERIRSVPPSAGITDGVMEAAVHMSDMLANAILAVRDP